MAGVDIISETTAIVITDSDGVIETPADTAVQIGGPTSIIETPAPTEIVLGTGNDGVPTSRTLTAGDGLTGGGDLTADRTFDVGTHPDGSITVNADDIQVGILATDVQHGTRGGGTQHLAATSVLAGFMSAADKANLDGLVATAVPSSRNLTAGAGMTGGGDLTADRTFDVVANVDASIVVSADDIRVGVLANDAQHGQRGGGTQHAVATGAVAGFMSAADKAFLDTFSVETDYLFLPGRAGGQTAFGGTASADDLDLAANTVGTGDGRINMNSPLVFGSYSATTASYGFEYTATESFTALFVGGGLNFSGNITFSAPTFIYESFRGAPSIFTAVDPGFAAYTVLQALPAMHSGAGAGHNPLSPLILNAGPSLNHAFTGVRTTLTMAAVNFAASIRTTSTGTLNVTNWHGMVVAPKFSTVAGSTVNFGTIRGLWCQTPSVAPFGQPQAGTELMAAFYAVDVDNLGTFGGAAPVAAIRSAIGAGTNQHFLLNTGGADSDFGGSDLLDVGVVEHLGDGPGFASIFGGGGDAGIWYDGTDLIVDPQQAGFGTTEFRASGIRVIGAIFPVSDFIREASSTTLLLSSWRLTGRTSGNMADGFGTAMFWSIEDDTSGRVNIAFYSAERAGADNTGRVRQWVYLAGSPIEALTYIGTQITLNLPTTITGRTKVIGAFAQDPISPAQLTADVDDYQGQGSGSALRGVLRVTSDASRTITGIDATTANFSEAGDYLRVVNVGAFDVVLGHQDAASLAANRIISPTGADLTLGPDESAVLWYDTASSRWRVLSTTGA